MILEKMNLEEVINPHYAFPIVGVILCALLVFAFGFKTPVQPPSFDFEEHRKATGRKKQKSKEKPKVVQNGSTPQSKVVTTAKQTDDQAVTPIVTPNTEKQTIKNDVKTKVKKSAATASNQQTSQPEVKQVTSEDTNGGQWTQQLSKKDRKNRKKEEPQDVEKSPKTKSKDEGSPRKAKNKSVKETVTATEEISKEETSTPVVETKCKAEIPAAKEQREPKKKVAAKVEEKSDGDTTPIVKTEPAKGKGKKEKKAEEVKVVEAAIETKPSAESPVSETEKSKTAEEEKTNDSGSTNVAFDELGDMWQDSKPQKKKKKARRE